MFIMYFIHYIPTNVFGHYSGQLQGDVIIRRIQKYKRGQMCHCHSITVKNYYNFS